MLDIAVLFGADRQRAIKEMRESLEFEIELAKIFNEEYNQTKIAYLQQKIPSIPWQEFLSKFFDFSLPQDIKFSLKYLSDFETLINKTPKR